MESSGPGRKLVAILCAVVRVNTSQTGEDSEALAASLAAHRKILADRVVKHPGQVVSSAGEALVAEFAVAEDAVVCAMKLQRQFDGLPPNHDLECRIGIHLGAAIIGHGYSHDKIVDIATEIMSLGEGGDICISGSVHDSIKDKLPYRYIDLGEKPIDHIGEPLRAYRVHPKLQGAKSVSPSVLPRNWRRAAIPVAIVLALGVGVILWYFNKSSPVPSPALPSIIVREGNNQTGDPEQDRFIAGIINHIVTKLVQLQNLKVMSTILPAEFPPPQDIDYLLELGLQKEGDKMALSGKLSDIKTKTYKLALIYGDILKDRFDAQDDIIQQILKEIPVVITEENKDCLYRKTTRNRKAKDAYDHAMASYNEYTVEGNAKAREQANQAKTYDPNFANAYALLAIVNAYDVRWGPRDKREYYKEAKEMADKALVLDDCTVLAYIALAYANLGINRHQLALENAKKATIYGPNDAEAHAYLSYILNYVGRTGEAITEMEKAKDHSGDNRPPWYQYSLGLSYFLEGKYKDAIELVEAPVEQTTNKKGSTYTWALFLLTVAYNAIDNEEKANNYRETLLNYEPDFCEVIRKTLELYTDIEIVKGIRELALRPNLQCE